VTLAKASVLDGKLQLVELLGRGSFGDVWGVIRLSDRKRFAAKILRSELIEQDEIVRRFDRERRCGSLVRSKYVAPVHEAVTAGPGPLYLVTDWYRGETLLARLAREKYLSFGEAAPIVEDLLLGVDAVHKAGVIHRDLKPANVFLARRRGGLLRAVVLDFGVAKVLGEGDLPKEMLTAKGATLGSLSFMAPEQVNGSSDADVRADLYAIGVIVYRMLTGVLPHAPTTAAELLAMKLDRDAPTLGSATGDRWPARLEAFIAALLHRSREARTPSAQIALQELRALRSLYPAIDMAQSSETESDELESAPTETGALFIPAARRSRLPGPPR